MPTAKGKGGSSSHRYRPASEYDDTTLAQKREYWRTKKREQRARLSDRRGKPTQNRRTEKLLSLNAPATVNSSVSCSFATPSFCMQSNHDMYKPANVSSAAQSGNTVGDSSPEAPQNQKEECLQTMELNKVSLQLPASCSMSAEAAGGNTATLTSRSAGDAVSRAVTSPTPSGTQINSSSSVPPVRVTRITNGSSAKTAPQPCVSMQGTSVPKMQQEAQVALCIQPKLVPPKMTTQEILVSSPCCPLSIKTEGKAANRTPQSTAKSALVTTQRAKLVGNSHPSMESEEERAAKRREHWRIKKREQRAKLAARIAKARERTQAGEMVVQRQTAQKTGLESSPVLQHFSSQPFLKAAGQRQGPIRVKASLTPAKRVNNKLQSGAAGLMAVNLQMNQMQNPHESRTTQTTTASNSILVKTSGESLRKFPSYVHFSNVSRGFARCKTPRQKFIEAQKNFMNQRIIRCKSLLPTVVFGSRIIPRIDPNLTTEQIIAKRREYWRIKKREQRAKLSMEVRARLKEKDSLMRRVKRYQRILEDMRKARAMTQAAGSTLTHASETIGGFIKEDGTLTINIPQGPTGSHTAAQKNQELHAGSNHTPITQLQQQPNTKRRGSTAVKLDQPPTVFHPAQVRLSLPLSGQLANKSARILSVRPRIQLERTVPNSHSSPIPAVGQLTLTHPQTPENTISGGSTAESHLSGCVMKMTVSTSAPSIPTLSLDPELTEEERMAKKREYWRIKKREQRAARAARLKQGSLQARANAVLQRKKAHRQVAVSPLAVSRILTNHTGSTPPLTKNSVPVTPNSNDIKQENESIPTVDLNSEPEHAICPDIKPPTSPPPIPSPVPQPESDAALSADSQATTLLAVASMKKLLEESLSTVGECKSEETDIKTETTEELSDSEITPNLPQLFFEKDDVDPITADLTLQIKSWQPDTDILMHKGLPSQETLPPLSASSEVVLHPTCDHSSQTSSNVILSPPIPASDGPSSPRRAQRLRNKKGSLPNCRSPEPPRLHHLPMDQLNQHIDQQSRVQEQRQNRNLPLAQRQCSVGTSQSSWSSLQQKREYWKLMKRQQRARLKARQKQRQGDRSSHLSAANIQATGLVIINTVKGVNTQTKPVLQLKPPVASPATVTSIPTVLVVSPATCNTQQAPDTLQVNPPVTGVPCSQTIEQSSLNTNPSNILSDCLRAPENQQQVGPSSQRWMPGETDMDPSACLPTLEPPENPLSSINLQPIEPPGQTPSSTLSPMKITCSQLQNPSHVIQSPAKLAPISTLVPPKPIPGESQEDFLKRKREYWRIKKKEQRARKAIRDKGIRPKRVSNNLRPILPADELPTHVLATQDSGQWVSSSDESEHLMSSSVDPDTSFAHFTVPLEDEPELLLSEYENNSSEEGSVSDTVWRNLYLMDYDPLNQLLVCMVCGELQYSHNLEGVRAHIDEAHPDTLTLEPGEKKRILEAWDEQVSQRERFFTSQLQQHSGSMAEAHGD